MGLKKILPRAGAPGNSVSSPNKTKLKKTKDKFLTGLK